MTVPFCNGVNQRAKDIDRLGHRIRRAATDVQGIDAIDLIVMGEQDGSEVDARIEGQIDARGTITGRLTSACSYQIVWQKKGK